MTKRDRLEAKKEKNFDKIETLKRENLELSRELCLLSDNEQWFTEEKEIVKVREGRKSIKVVKLIGRIHWNEDFVDEDTGNVVTVPRSQVVRVNGEWDW